MLNRGDWLLFTIVSAVARKKIRRYRQVLKTVAFSVYYSNFFQNYIWLNLFRH
jgi:hypothetical protein